ncbi:MAG TPA: phage tail sheath family protein [Bacteroidetes bacterium]|nr:phage tail sheath family protein [Bacteroidota bacterium]
MPDYKTPGVYIEEISVFPPSVAAVETAIPAFIGYTAVDTDKDGNTLVNVPTRITSLLEYESIFGKGFVESITVNVDQTFSNGALTGTSVSFAATPTPSFYLYYAMQLYFSNGGGPCYIVSIGDYGTAYAETGFTAAINILEEKDEPTLLVFPDACLGTDTNVGNIVVAALAHCNKMQDRFTIADVRNAIPGGTATDADVTANFRTPVSSSDIEQLKYGAAYFPYLNTSIPFFTNDANVQIAAHNVSGTGTLPTPITGGTAINDNAVKQDQTIIYNAVKTFLSQKFVTVPPSGAVAGIYARVDESRGVWKAPANTGVTRVVGPAINITNDLNDGLNVTDSGKSVNVIRAFKGKGTLVWGARTLAGNDNEWRYVPVRRFFIFVEESVKKATERFVFEPNDANTWVKVRSMIENFLTVQWRAGALAGPTPESAFFVKVGLNETMSAVDILEGKMIVEIGMAVVRPAEFIILRFSHKMQEA